MLIRMSLHVLWVASKSTTLPKPDSEQNNKTNMLFYWHARSYLNVFVCLLYVVIRNEVEQLHLQLLKSGEHFYVFLVNYAVYLMWQPWYFRSSRRIEKRREGLPIILEVKEWCRHDLPMNDSIICRHDIKNDVFIVDSKTCVILYFETCVLFILDAFLSANLKYAYQNL